MIRYSLTCANDHSFESWFQSAEAFDRLSAQGMVACSVCGGTSIDKKLMAPTVRPSRKAAVPAPVRDAAPADPAARARELAELKRKIEESSDYVGANFAAEARAIHDGDAPERAIYGEARLDEARSLIADGVPVLPLPFLPTRKVN